MEQPWESPKSQRQLSSELSWSPGKVLQKNFGSRNEQPARRRCLFALSWLCGCRWQPKLGCTAGEPDEDPGVLPAPEEAGDSLARLRSPGDRYTEIRHMLSYTGGCMPPVVRIESALVSGSHLSIHRRSAILYARTDCLKGARQTFPSPRSWSAPACAARGTDIWLLMS